MPFETFKRQRAPVTHDPAITIQKRGTVSFNLPAYTALGEPEAVELLFDREQRLMGIRKVDPSVPHGYGVRPLGRGHSTWLISGRAFMTYYEIPSEVARRWMAHMDADVLVVDLKEPGTEVVGNRTRTRERSVTS